jgi:membrane-associated phospholipid phosphatase
VTETQAPTPSGPEVDPEPDPERSARRGLRWWKEVGMILAFYTVYSVIRNTQGSAAVSAARAMRNAVRVIRWEKATGLYFEEGLQQAFLAWDGFIEFWNVFYGTFHFVVTVFALVLLFRRFPARYRRWRNTLAATTALALIGFAAYPLMPPRLMPASYGFVDTLRTYDSLWSFDSGAMSKVSNQYAAMPSLHFAWATWCTFVLVPAVRSWWAKALAVIYPALTLFAIVVTGNHFVLDAVGGVVVLGLGAVIGFAIAARFERSAERRAARSPEDGAPGAGPGDRPGGPGEGGPGDGQGGPGDGPPVASAVVRG